MPEPLRSAWLYGDWDVFAGQYFDMWDPSIHIIDDKKAKSLGFGQEHNVRYMGIDWGYAAPFAAVWIEVTSDHKVMAYRELYGKEKHPYEWGQMIYELNKGENISQSYADPSMWIRNPMNWHNPATQMYSDKHIASAMCGNGNVPMVQNMVPANNDRINGWRNLATFMSHSKERKSKFYIKKDTCPNLIRTIPDMVRDEKRVEDIDTTLEDHIVDALRYAFTGTQAPLEPVKKIPKRVLETQALLDGTYGKKGWTYNFGEE